MGLKWAQMQPPIEITVWHTLNRGGLTLSHEAQLVNPLEALLMLTMEKH